MKNYAWCPACHESTMISSQLESNLPSSQCTKCGGTWLNAENYGTWLQNNAKTPASNLNAAQITLCAAEKSGPMLCPECNYILLAYRVGKGLDFSLNRCAHCGGMWFDQNEWATMKSRGLHDQVHLVFSKPWQDAIEEEVHKKAMSGIWLEHLGERDYTEIERIKNWLQHHPKSGELYAYLLADRYASRDDAT